jgi:hypothetical protein
VQRALGRERPETPGGEEGGREKAIAAQPVVGTNSLNTTTSDIIVIKVATIVRASELLFGWLHGNH